MSLWLLILKELWHRRVNAVLSLLTITTAVMLFVAYFTTATAAQRETVRITRDLGFNLRILPRSADLDAFWRRGYAEETMPEETLTRFAQYRNVFLSYNHLVALLQQRVPIQGLEVILTGVAPTITAPEQRKQPMGFQIQAGTVFVGAQVAQRLGLQQGDTLNLGAESFRVAQRLAESGTDDDVRVFGLLSDVQRVLRLPGRINEIRAIDCLCLTADQEPLKILRAELARALPEAQVLQVRALAEGRARQRQLTDRYFAAATPFLLVVCAITVGLLAVLNARERRVEIGILRALGKPGGYVARLFLGKALLLGLLGAVCGYVLGTTLALMVGPELFRLTTPTIRGDPRLFIGALLMAPAFAALASCLPAILAATQDPAAVLREG